MKRCLAEAFFSCLREVVVVVVVQFVAIDPIFLKKLACKQTKCDVSAEAPKPTKTCDDLECDPNAVCVFNPEIQEPICQCDHGYEGDGSFCAFDPGQIGGAGGDDGEQTGEALSSVRKLLISMYIKYQ